MQTVNSLDFDTITRLLADEQLTPQRKFPIPIQEGPLRFVDEKLRCASRNCSSPTYIKIKGIPYCMMHSLRELNEIIVNMMLETDWPW